MENLEILSTKREELYNNLKELTNRYRGVISTFIEASLGKEWGCTNLYDESLQLGFVDGSWKDGTPRFQTFDIYYKVKECDYNFKTHEYGPEYFKFQMNTACFGSFNIEGESMPKTYYIGVGKLLSDVDLQSKIKLTLTEFHVKYDEIRKEACKVDNEIEAIKLAERAAQEKREEDALLALQKEALAEVPAGETRYVVICKGSSKANNYTYRKQPVRWGSAEIFEHIYHAECEARMLNRSGYGVKYAAIEVSKLKAA